MLIRLLVAVLTLVGPMPFRVCTCAASSPATATVGSIPAPRAASRTCDCAHSAPSKPSRATTPSVTQGPAHDHDEPAVTGHNLPQQDRHEKDCPAINPRPAVGEAVITPATIPTADCTAALLPVGVTPVSFARAPDAYPAEQFRAPGLPLYLTFLSLRN